MVMQFSTGHTSQQRLQPTHSSSSTRGMRASGVRRFRATLVQLGDRRDGDARRGCARFARCPGGACAVEMDALVRAVPAGDVAEVAADALLAIDARDDLVVQVEMLPLGDPAAGSARGNRRWCAKPFSSIQLPRPSIMSSTMRKP